MNLLETIRKKASSLNKTVVLPESGDIRTIQAANYLAEHGLCKPVLIGNADEITRFSSDSHHPLHPGVGIVDPAESQWLNEFANFFHEKRKDRGLTLPEARNIMQNELFFAASMVAKGYADGCVAGAVNTTGDVLRAAIQVIGLRPGSKVVSSVFLMSLSNGRVLTYGDCAVVPYPDAAQLGSIAIDSARSHEELTGETARVAMLSFSTKGSARHDRVSLITEATELAKTMNPDLLIDGELQFDAAFVPEIGARKSPGSEVAGSANVFVFPNLDAGNIGYKITERLAGATATGPIIQGLAAPMNDLSRGATWEDIVNTVCVTVLQASGKSQKRQHQR